MDHENRWESGEGQLFGRLTQSLAVGAVPGMLFLSASCREKSTWNTYQASEPVMISLFTRASRQACSATLLPREGGIGNDKYMKGLYVVDV